MREERRRESGVSEVDSEVPAFDVDQTGGTTKFSNRGAIPPVSGDGNAHAIASASDRAYGTDGTYRADSMLGFDGFDGLGGRKKPHVPSRQLPLTGKGDLEARAARSDVEALLTSRGAAPDKSASQALDLLVNLPESYRGKVIDGLGAKAFENLVDRISDADRERFELLLVGTRDPERKLRLWAEAHKARATNNVDRYKGNIGAPIATYEEEDEDGNVTNEIDEEEEDEIRKTLTRDQLRSRKRHLRRQAAANTTRDEVDGEVKVLLAKAKKGQLSLNEVDELRERKDLEYKIELDSNVNLTAETTPRASGDAVYWKKEELEQVQRTLPRVPQAQDPDGFEELRRTASRSFDGIGGIYHNNDRMIEIRDFGASQSPGYRHGGDKRELVSDEFKQKNGDAIGTLEFVLTHESGHNADATHGKAYEAFQKAAGWQRVKVDALRADHISEKDITRLEERRSNPNAKTSDIQGNMNIYSPIENSKDEYWAVPITAIPAQDEARPGPNGEDTWAYARVNPDEHFAEVYAKAVHVPEKLHHDLVELPTEAAAKARDAYLRVKSLVDGDLKLAHLRVMLGVLKASMQTLEKARDQRVAEFEVMRNTVFGTDKAVKLSTERLEAKKVSAAKIEEFNKRAAIASTPEQVAYLEAEVSK